MSDHDQTTEAGMGVSPPNLSGESGDTTPGSGGSLVQQGNTQQEDEARHGVADSAAATVQWLQQELYRRAKEARERRQQGVDRLINDGYALRRRTE